MTATAAPSENHRPTILIAVSVETIATMGIFFAALVLRALKLGEPSLSEGEARQAMAVWSLIRDSGSTLGVVESPVTFGSLLLSFTLAGATNAAARFGPMMAGVALVFTPLLFRERLGRLPALIATALLALSPTAVITSRQVGGTPFAVLALILALAAFDRYQRNSQQPRLMILIGVLLGVALLADAAIFLSLVALVLGVIFALLTDEEGELEDADWRGQLAAIPYRTLIGALLATVLIVSTLFFLAPSGLGAAADQLARFAGGIVRRPGAVPWLGLVMALYEPGLIVFGLIGTWLASQSSRPAERVLAGWAFVSLVLFAIYPGALPNHTLWVVVPLVILAASAITAILSLENDAPAWASRSHAIAVLAFFGMIFVSLSQYLRTPRMIPIPQNPEPGQQVYNLPVDLLFMVMWMVLLIVLWFVVANFWEARTAWRGLGLGMLALVSIWGVGQSGALAFTRADSAFEPFNVLPAQPGVTLLIQEAEGTSDLSVGHPHEATITVQSPPDGTLAWALREFTQVTFVERVDPRVDSIMAITPGDAVDPALGSAYVGQDFVITRYWTSRGLPIGSFIQWMFYRNAPTRPAETKAILWVREDVYRLVPAVP